MVAFTLNFDSQTPASPIYLQLYGYLKDEIISGRLEPQSKMPSARALSAHLHISRNTVNTAYSQLQAEGYLESIPRSGYYVSHEIDAAFSGFFSDSVPAAMSLQPIQAVENCRYDFRHGKIDSAGFPNQIFRKIINQCLSDETPSWTTYGDPQGEYGLRLEIAKYLRNARGVRCNPEQIVLTSGTQHGLDLICKLIKDTYSEVAIEEPGYLGGRVVLSLNDFKTLPIPLEATGISMTALRDSQARVVLVTPSHQFPKGIIMPVSKRVALLRWAEENNGLILENDYEGEFSYSGKPIPCLQSFDSSGRVIYLCSFSNSLFPSVRTGFIVLPLRLTEKYRSVLGLMEQTVPTLMQKALELFISEGHFERHIRKTKKIYSKKYAVLIEAIQEQLKDKVEIVSNHAGLHVLLKVNNSMTEQELIARANAQGVKIYPSSHYWMKHDAHSEAQVMLGFGTMDERAIVEGITLLRSAWFNNSPPTNQ